MVKQTENVFQKLLIVVLFTISLSCNNSDETKKSADIFISGNGMVDGGTPVGLLTHNHALKYFDGDSEFFSKVEVDDSKNIYYLGIKVESPAPKAAYYWKNGERFFLPELTVSSNTIHYVNDVFTNGVDVYFSGYAYDFNVIPYGRRIPVYWKNNQIFALPIPNDKSGMAERIIFSNGEVYVSGTIDNKPVYWRNTTVHYLPLPESFSSCIVGQIQVHNGKVYVIGNLPDDDNTEDGILWTDNSYTLLSLINNETKGSYVSDLLVLQDKVIIAGNQYEKMEGVTSYKNGYWLNQEWKSLEKGNTNSEPIALTTAVDEFNGDIYLLGIISSQEGWSTALWKNDKIEYIYDKFYIGVGWPMDISIN